MKTGGSCEQLVRPRLLNGWARYPHPSPVPLSHVPLVGEVSMRGAHFETLMRLFVGATYHPSLA